MMRNGNEHTLDFYTTPQPTDYVKKERKKKKSATDGGNAGAEPLSMDDDPYEPPIYDESPHRTYYTSFSPYGWEDN